MATLTATEGQQPQDQLKPPEPLTADQCHLNTMNKLRQQDWVRPLCNYLAVKSGIGDGSIKLHYRLIKNTANWVVARFDAGWECDLDHAVWFLRSLGFIVEHDGSNILVSW